MPGSHQRVLGEVVERVEDVREVLVELRRARQHVGAGLEGVGEDRGGVRQHGHARAQLAEEGRVVAHERPLLRELLDRDLLAGRLFEIDSWRNGRATRASAVKVVSRLTNSAACSSATGATSSAARAERAGRSGRAACRVGRGSRATGSRSGQRHERLDRLVDVLAAAREAAAEAVQRVALSPTRVFASNMLKRSSSSTDGAARAWRSGIVAPAAKPGPALAGRELDVLESERRARAHEQRGVAGSGSSSLSSFSVTCA